MAASQPNKPTMKEDGEDEMAGWWEKATKKLREEDAAKLKKKKEEELEKERKEKERASNAMRAREQALVRKCEEAQKKRLKDFQERTMKLWAIAAEKEERENQIFMERVVKEAHLIRKREEEEEEEEGKGAFLYAIELCHPLRFGCELLCVMNYYVSSSIWL
nr:inner centromere protein-like [Aegilops tauschii subsp. strangulata]